MFPQQHLALVYGDSVFLSGVAEILRSFAQLEVVELKPHAESTLLVSKRPDVVFVDATQIAPNQVKELMELFPSSNSPLFLSLDADTMHVTVLSAQQFPAVNLSDLTQVLEKITQLIK